MIKFHGVHDVKISPQTARAARRAFGWHDIRHMVGDRAWNTGNQRLRLMVYVTYVEMMSHTQLHIYIITNWDAHPSNQQMNYLNVFFFRKLRVRGYSQMVYLGFCCSPSQCFDFRSLSGSCGKSVRPRKQKASKIKYMGYNSPRKIEAVKEKKTGKSRK